MRDKDLNEIRSIFAKLTERYFAQGVHIDITAFADIAVGVSFKVYGIRKHIHHYVPEVKIIDRALISNNATLTELLMREVGESIVYQIGNHQIDEADNPNFCQDYGYTVEKLEALHVDEDSILESAQAMLLGVMFPEFDRNIDKDYALLAPFSKDEFIIIKNIYSGLVKKFDLAGNDIIARSFFKNFKSHKYQMVSLIIESKDYHGKLVINIFENQIHQYIDKFVQRGIGEDQAIYFILKTYLQAALDKAIIQKQLSRSVQYFFDDMISRMSESV